MVPTEQQQQKCSGDEDIDVRNRHTYNAVISALLEIQYARWNLSFEP
jgi:hypothetical protein